ncbi:hypothetical protein [Pontibacter brevis]
MPLSEDSAQVLAVRFALQKNLPYLQFGDAINPALRIRVNEVSAAVQNSKSIDLTITPFEYFRAGFFFILAVLHFAFFCFYPPQRANLYFFLYSFLSALSSSTGHLAYNVMSIETKMHVLIFTLAVGLVLNHIFYIAALYHLFTFRKGT